MRAGRRLPERDTSAISECMQRRTVLCCFRDRLTRDGRPPICESFTLTGSLAMFHHLLRGTLQLAARIAPCQNAQWERVTCASLSKRMTRICVSGPPLHCRQKHPTMTAPMLDVFRRAHNIREEHADQCEPAKQASQ